MKLIRHCVLLVLALVLTSCTSHYYVVRHAEKLNQTDNSPLSGAGLRRAKILAEKLSTKDIHVIFVSDKQRTQQTAAPTAERFSIDPIIIPIGETNRVIKELKKISGRNVLVVRHSNEIHLIVNALSPFDNIDPIPDEFDNLFVITKRKFLWSTQISLERLKY